MDAIVSVTRDWAIGKDGALLVRNKADMHRFVELTRGCTCVMGRKTYESFPGGPLKGRRNVIVTHDASYVPPKAEDLAAGTSVDVVTSPQAALDATATDTRVFSPTAPAATSPETTPWCPARTRSSRTWTTTRRGRLLSARTAASRRRASRSTSHATTGAHNGAQDRVYRRRRASAAATSSLASPQPHSTLSHAPSSAVAMFCTRLAVPPGT